MTKGKIVWFFIALWSSVLSGCSMGAVTSGNYPEERGIQSPQAGETDFTTRESLPATPNSKSPDTDPANKVPVPPPPGGSADEDVETPDKSGLSPHHTNDIQAPAEEADIYRVLDNKLYLLNTYKGLVIFDLKDPSAPKKLSTAPIFGVPVEMIIASDKAWILVKDALTLQKKAGTFSFGRKNVSQLVLVDLTDVKKPTILQRFDIIGQIKEGVSRKLGQILYVVSHTDRTKSVGWSYEETPAARDQVTIYAFDLSQKSSFRLLKKLDLVKNLFVDTAQKNPMLLEITVTASGADLLVAERWQLSTESKDTRWSCKIGQRTLLTRINVIDLSQPNGQFVKKSEFMIDGQLTDQFKQTTHARTDGRHLYLGIFQHKRWDPIACQWTKIERNTFVSVELQDNGFKLLKEKEFTPADQDVRASHFDLQRERLYINTNSPSTSSLYTLRFDVPEAPVVTAVIENFRMDVTFFRVLPGARLLAVGKSQPGSCQGLNASQIAVSMLDIKDVDQLKEQARRCTTSPSYSNSNSTNTTFTTDLTQAHKRVGFHYDGSTHLISIPVEIREKKQDGSTELRTAISLLTWENLSSSAEQLVFRDLGTLIHPKGVVKRSVIFRLGENAGSQQPSTLTVLNISETHLSLFDLKDLKNPNLLATIELSPYVGAIYRFGDYLVEQVNLGPGFELFNQFRVKKIGPVALNEAPVLSSMAFGKIDSVLRIGNTLVLFSPSATATKESVQEIQLIDFSDPRSPQKRGTLKLPFKFSPNYRFYCGSFERSHEFTNAGDGKFTGSRWLPIEGGLASLAENEKKQTVLLFFDFSTPNTPKVKTILLNTTREYLYLVPSSTQRFFVVAREQLHKQDYADYQVKDYRYYTQNWIYQKSVWSAGPLINLPGRLLMSFQESQTIKLVTYTQTTLASGANKSLNTTSHLRLYLLSLSRSGDLATVLSTHTLDNWKLHDLQLSGQRLFINASQLSTTQNNATFGTSLLIFDLFNDTFKLRFSGNIGAGEVRLMGIFKQKLFLEIEQTGILVADVSDPTRPTGLHFERTFGWVTNISFYLDQALIASGHYGIYQLSLSETSL